MRSCLAVLFIATASAEVCTEAEGCNAIFEEHLEESMSTVLLQQSMQQKKAQANSHSMMHKHREPIDPADVLGTCTGSDDSDCPPEYSADRPCPPGCTALESSSSDDSTTVTTVTTTTTTTTTTTVTTVATGSDSSTATTMTDGTLTWSTSNSNSYMCSSMGMSISNGTVTCAQSGYEDGVGGTASLACSSGSIACFFFASGGKVGGSCSGDEFYEDGDDGWGCMADSVGLACIGESSCDLEVSDGTVNDVAVSPAATAGNGKFNFKTLALCA